MSENGIKKIKCVYCGNNPTNHTLSYIFQTLMVLISPLTRMISYLQNRYVDRLIEIIATPYVWLFTKLHIWGINTDMSKAKTERSLVIWQEAEKRGIKMEQLVIFGKPVEQYRARINGKLHYFESIPVPSSFQGKSYAWMDDKWTLKEFFKKHDIPVAYGASVASHKHLNQIFNHGRPPFITKPRLGSRGRHTTTFLNTKEDLKNGFDIAKKLGCFVIVEEHLHGSVYRGTYVNGEVVGILRGDPPRVKGDGASTIEELISIKNKAKHPEVKDVLITPRLEEFIARQGLNLKSVIEKDRVIDLSEKIGISYGGFAAEEITKTHPKTLEYIKRAGDLLAAPVVGFDFIIPNIEEDPDNQRWGIIEANSLPFINLHHFPLEGEPINVAAKVWDLWD